MFSLFQNQQMAQVHRKELQQEAACMRASDSTNSHSQGKQGSHHLRAVVRRTCLLAFSLGVIAGGMLNTHFGLLPIMLLGSITALITSPPILIQSATASKAHLYTYWHGRTGHQWRGSRLSR